MNREMDNLVAEAHEHHEASITLFVDRLAD